MSLLLAALLTANPLPFIDRSALRTLAKLEATRNVRPAVAANKSSVARLCAAVTPAVPPRMAIGRGYSMSGPEVSILKTTCAVHRSSRTRIAAR